MAENNKLPKLNIMIVGKTGVGKSTLLNSLFGENLALTGSGEPITEKIHKFETEGFPISIYDTPGMELDGKHSAENLLNDITGQIQKMMQCNDIEQAIHCVLYCINATSSRIEKAEIDFLQKLTESTSQCNTPVILVLTQAFSEKKTGEMTAMLRNIRLPIRGIVPVLAKDYEIGEGFPTIKAYGLDKLVDSAENLLEEVSELINSGIQSEDVNQAIHCIWYCINTMSNRIEPAEMDFLRKLGEKTKKCNVPVILVLTQAFVPKKTEEMVTVIRKANLPIRVVVPVLAQDYEIGEGIPKVPAFGIDKLVEEINKLLPDTVRDTFVALQIASIDLKRKRARAVVTGAAGTAALTGAAPIPFSDAAILVPTQVSMLAGITAVFGLPLEKSALTSIVSATIGTAGTTVLGKTVVANLVKMIPGAGTIVGAVISGTTAATLTGALGEAYIAILTRVASGNMSFAELTSSEGMKELRREFEKQLRMSRS